MQISACHQTNRYIDQPCWPPLVQVRLDEDQPAVWCKLEFLNPSGSTKDRIAAFILSKAMRRGELTPGGTVIEASSGSTSIALALACAQLGLVFIAVMPEGVSRERVLIIREYGGECVFTPAEEGIAGALRTAEELAEKRDAFLPRQFSNPDNAAAHQHQTAREILAQLGGRDVDAVVSGVGTGGTLVGLYHGFREFGCRTRPFAARPIHGLTLGGPECCSFSSRIPGVIEGLSTIYRNAVFEELVELQIEDDAALAMTRRLIRLGFPVGPSSGLNFCAAIEAAAMLSKDSTIVTVFPDRMERYFSTELFSQD